MKKQASKPQRKKKLGNYPHAMVIFSITLALFVIGLFGVLLIHAAKLSEIVKESLEMQVYLDKDMPDAQRAHLARQLAAKDFVATTPDGKAQIKFISKEEGAKQFIEETNEDFTEFLGENPLRDVYLVRIKPDYSESSHLRKIKEELERQKGVFEVEYVESLFESINQNLRKISFILIGFAAILVLVVVILINNTIKLALYSQRFLIRSMQLVGATSFFIQRPFLNRATWQGIISGILASVLLFGLLQYVYSQINELELLRNDEQLWLLMGALVVLGCVIGFLSSYRAIRKYLRLSLDELY